MADEPGKEGTKGDEGGEPKVDPTGVVEAALFSAGRPLEKEEIAEATGLGKRDINKALNALMKDYKGRETSLTVAKVGEKYTMALKADYAGHARKLAEMEIPLKTLKTAALIAFHQPLKQSELQDMIGSKVYDHVGVLVELGLIRARAHERTKLLTTTERFSEYFGIDTLDKTEIRKWLAEKTGIELDREGETLDDYAEEGDGTGGDGGGSDGGPAEGGDADPKDGAGEAEDPPRSDEEPPEEPDE